MTAQRLLVHQEAGQVREVGSIVYIDGDPFEVMAIKPKVEEGVFIDYGSLIESRVVEMTVQRYEERPSAEAVA